MKFYTSQIDKLIAEIKRGNIHAIFLHGPNKGYFIEIIKRITEALNAKTRSLPCKDLNAANLKIYGSSTNFFKQQELINITDVTSLDKDVKELLTKNILCNFICMTASDIVAKTAATKMFFEKSANLASIGCYADEPKHIVQYVLQECTKNNKSINEDALTFLKFHLSSDHNIIKQEVKKLFIYLYDKNHITLEDVKSCISADTMSNFTEMCLYFAQKNTQLFLQEVDKLKAEGTNEIVILKALAKFYFNLYIVTSKIEHDINIDIAIKSLSPPIFFKYIPDFKQVVNSINSRDIMHVMHKLYQAETRYKQHPDCFDFVFLL